MQISKPRGLISGFMAAAPDELVPELVHAGEQWVPGRFFVPEHAHSVWEFYLQADGVSRWNVLPPRGAPRRYELRAGDFFAAPPGLKHTMADDYHGVAHGHADAVAALERAAKHHFYFAALDLSPILERLPECRGVWNALQPHHFSGDARLSNAFRLLLREVARQGFGRERGVRLSLDLLVLEASRALQRGENASANDCSGTPGIVLRARECLETEPGRSWKSAELARVCGASANHLIELFSRETGMPPRQYLLQVRIERAKELLRGDLSVAHIARELGFSSPQHFANTFRARVGVSPRAWRDSRNG